MNFAGAKNESETRPQKENRLIRHFRLFAGIATLAMLSFPTVYAAAREQAQPAPQAPVQVPPAQTQPPSGPAPAAPPATPPP